MNTLFKTFRVVVSVVVLVAGMTSCAKDTDVADPYANWEERNVAFIDSIADVVANPPKGEIWEKYFDYTISFDKKPGDLLDPYEKKNEDYVYVKYKTDKDKLTEDDMLENGEYPIMYNDTVMAAYQGFLINGVRFDGSYYGDFDREVTDNFSKFSVNGVIPGWTTVLLNMKPRTQYHMEVYIPYRQAYYNQTKESIPKGSALVFEMYVDEVIKPKLQK